MPFEPHPESEIDPHGHREWRKGRHGRPPMPPPWMHDPRFRREFWRENHHAWRKAGFKFRPRPRRQFLFWRFAGTFGLISLLLVGGMGALAYLFTGLVGGTGQTAILVWVTGCGLAVTLPLLAIAVAVSASRGITRPLADVMQAAESVADGDLSIRVDETNRGEFGQLTFTFNRMIAELQRAEEQRRNLTADVAHELRTPLHIIQGNLEGILDGVYQPTTEHITALLEETHRLARLVEDLHILSLAESGHLPLRDESVLISDLLSDVATSFSGQAEAAEIRLTVETGAGIKRAEIRGDTGRLNQVLTNLIANALRYTPAGGVITLRAELTSESIQFQVKDTGAGIPETDVPYVFDRFWKGDASRTHIEGAGSGLGLAIARQLIQLHGGEIEVDSVVGQGTTFTINLPLNYDPNESSSRTQ